MEFYADEQLEMSSRLKDGLLLTDLINDMSTEFVLDAAEVSGITDDLDNLDGTDAAERQVDTCFDWKDVAPLVNLDCLQVEPNDLNLSPFDTFRDKMSLVTDDGGVRKLVIRPGVGNVVPPNAVVYVHYNSYLELEEVPFDTSYLRCQKPQRFQLGIGSLYEGFELSITTMKKNEKSQFLVEPDYAFGAMGAPPRIPAKATILLEIELLNFVDCGSITDEKIMTPNDRKKFPGAYKAALGFHALANDYFKQSNVPAAVDNYRKAENLLAGCVMYNDEEETAQKKLLMKIYVNLCICFNTSRMKSPEKACCAAQAAMRMSPNDARNNAKLQFNWGKALMVLNDFKRAGEHLKRALAIEPTNLEISQQLKSLDQKKKKYFEHEKISYKKAFAFSPSQKSESKNQPQEEGDVKAKSHDGSALPLLPEETASSEFIHQVTQQLEEFQAGCESRIRLPPGLTESEKRACRQIADRLGLAYKEQITDGACVVSIAK